MKINTRKAGAGFKPRRVYADGIEIFQAWYVDADAMIVKTYDVLGDRLPHLMPDLEGRCLPFEVEVLEGNLASRTIHAKEIEVVMSDIGGHS